MACLQGCRRRYQHAVITVYALGRWNTHSGQPTETEEVTLGRPRASQHGAHHAQGPAKRVPLESPAYRLSIYRELSKKLSEMDLMRNVDVIVTCVCCCIFWGPILKYTFVSFRNSFNDKNIL